MEGLGLHAARGLVLGYRKGVARVSASFLRPSDRQVCLAKRDQGERMSGVRGLSELDRFL
jgi:hypothetical protein